MIHVIARFFKELKEAEDFIQDKKAEYLILSHKQGYLVISERQLVENQDNKTR